MPRYYFHVHDDFVAHDEEGAELPNLPAARQRALTGARDLIAEQVTHGYLVLSHSVDVMDEQGDVVLSVPFRDAVAIRE